MFMNKINKAKAYLAGVLNRNPLTHVYLYHYTKLVEDILTHKII